MRSVPHQEKYKQSLLKKQESNEMDRNGCTPQYQASSPAETYLISVGFVFHSRNLCIEVAHIGYQEAADQVIKGSSL